MDTLPLHSTHEANGAVFGERSGREVVLHYGDPAGEYAAARATGVFVDLSFRDSLRITGEDRGSFLHGMCTNDINGLPAWGTTYAAMITVKGAMVADLRVAKRPAELVLDLEPGLYSAVHAFLEKYLISEDAELHDGREDFAVVGLVGPGSLEAAQAVFGLGGPGARGTFEGQDVIGLPSLLTAGPGVDVLLPRQALAQAWARLADGAGPGLRAAGVEALEWVRVEDGIPRFGVDLLETTIPLEANLSHAIHYQKGCYVGQEVIARATFRGQMNKKLSGLLLGDHAVDFKTELRKDGKKVGFVTSVVRSPKASQHIALGYVHRDHLAPGTVLELADTGQQATVQALPFGGA